MHWCFLGRVDYQEGLALQTKLRDAISHRKCPDTLILLEHDPVITLGRSARETHVLISSEEQKQRGIDVVKVGRGGDVTYHGPGQLVGYPIRYVGRKVKDHVKGMIDALVAQLESLGIHAWWREDHPGVWTPKGKIGAIGVDARGGVAMHGFSLNVRPELGDYQMIVPCGLTAPVTSIQAMLGEAPELYEVARKLAPDICSRYHSTAEEILGTELCLNIA